MYLGLLPNTTDKAGASGRQPTPPSLTSRCIRASGWTRFSKSCRVRKSVAAPYYNNGDAVTMIDENPDPSHSTFRKEGTNPFVDAMCIPKNAKNVSGCGEVHQLHVPRPRRRWQTGSMSGYSSPQTEVYNELDEETTRRPAVFPGYYAVHPTEAYTNPPTEINQYYNDLWVDIYPEKKRRYCMFSNSTRILPISTRAGILYWKSEFSIG